MYGMTDALKQETNRHLLVHLYCSICYPAGELALCGYELTGEDCEEEAECIVCIELDKYECPGCGS